jgi:hypothetical protein
MRGHKYAICAENALKDPVFVTFADTIEEAGKIKFDAEFAGFAHATILDGNLDEVE